MRRRVFCFEWLKPERIPHITRRMIGWNVQGIEIIILSFYLWSFRYVESDFFEYFVNLASYLSDRM